MPEHVYLTPVPNSMSGPSQDRSEGVRLVLSNPLSRQQYMYTCSGRITRGPEGAWSPWETGWPPRNIWFERVQGGLKGASKRPPEITSQIQYWVPATTHSCL